MNKMGHYELTSLQAWKQRCWTSRIRSVVKTVPHKFSRQQDCTKRRHLPFDTAPYPRRLLDITPPFLMQYFKVQSSNLRFPPIPRDVTCSVLPRITLFIRRRSMTWKTFFFQNETGPGLHITSHGIEAECKKKKLGNLNVPCSSLIHKCKKEFGRGGIITVGNVYFMLTFRDGEEDQLVAGGITITVRGFQLFPWVPGSNSVWKFVEIHKGITAGKWCVLRNGKKLLHLQNSILHISCQI